MLDRREAEGGPTRRLVAWACAIGLLLALPASAGAAKVIDVPATAKFRAGNTTPADCQAFLFLEWPEQANAEAWEIEYDYYKGTSKILVHKEVTMFPPFDDALKADRGWVPAAGSHWHYVTYAAKSAPGKTVECASLEADLLGRVGTATVHVTVPDDPEEEEPEEEESPETPPDGEDDPDSSSTSEKDPPDKKAGGPKCRGNTPTIFARPGSPTNGTPRRDVILGTFGRDVIRARGGNDLVCGLGGNDLILGGAGRDMLLGQGGKDTLRGQGAKDLLLGGNGPDRLFGGAAADRLFGQAGPDLLNGGPGRPDLCNGGPGRDRKQSPGCERRKRIP